MDEQRLRRRRPQTPMNGIYIFQLSARANGATAMTLTAHCFSVSLFFFLLLKTFVFVCDFIFATLRFQREKVTARSSNVLIAARKSTRRLLVPRTRPKNDDDCYVEFFLRLTR